MQQSGAPLARRDFDAYDVQVLISASMPAASLRALFAQAADYGPQKVRFVLRGFRPKKLGQTIAYFRQYFPDPAQDFVIIEVDPPMFRALGVQSVPAFFVKDERGQWWETRGDMSLSAARDHVRRPGAELVAGPLYPIDEPDLIDLLAAEARQFDWAAYQAQIEQAIESGMIDSGVRLPLAARDAQRYHTPAVPLLQDMVAEDEQGRHVVLAREGQTINPLQYQTMGKTIVVLDAGSPAQIAWARRLVRGNRGGSHAAAADGCVYDVFFVGKASLYDMREAFAPCQTWPLWQPFAQGFGVRATPSIIEQQGERFMIREVDVSRKTR